MGTLGLNPDIQSNACPYLPVGHTTTLAALLGQQTSAMVWAQNQNR